MATFQKDPDEVLDFGVDWGDALETGEAVSTSVWEVDSGITVDSEVIEATKTTVWVSGGAPRGRYTFLNRVTTDNVPSRTIERAFDILVKNTV